MGIRTPEERTGAYTEAVASEGEETAEAGFMEITDVFDYQYMIQNTYIELLIEKPQGEQWLLEVEKEPDEDLGIVF